MREVKALVVFLGCAAATACASAGSPPGGPPDVLPPQVIEFTPDSGTVNFSGRAVIIRFDETINDRGTGQAALEALVLISPRDGEPRVSWDRDRIAVRPRNGFRPNTAYSITIAPGISDLRSNTSKESRSITFSTGPQIPPGGVSGTAFDWPGQQVSRRAWVEALRTRDSAVFVTTADSAGRFDLGALAVGEYVVRGYVDQNNNRVLDRTEIWDSVRVAVRASPVRGVELLLAPRDTLPARIANVLVTDSVTLALEFDKPLAPAQQFGDRLVRVVRADSTPVAIARVATRQQYDSARAAAAAQGDASPQPPASRQPTPARDTTSQPLRPSQPAPPTTLVVVLAQPLAAGTTYRVTVSGIRTLQGRESTATRLITSPVRDTTRAPGDTTRSGARNSAPPEVPSGRRSPRPSR